MKTLKEIFNAFEGEWLYYQSIRDKYNTYDKVTKDSVQFLIDQFNHGSKLEMAEHLTEMAKGDGSIRATHVINVYCLGQYLKPILFSEDEINENNKYSFNWHWFLLAFFHDAAYRDNKEEVVLNESGLNYGYEKSSKGLLHPVSKIKDYYEKRKETGAKHSGYDHGIVGAELLYTSYEKMLKNESGNYGKVDASINYFIYNSYGEQLLISEEALKEVAKIAKILACHNMWQDNTYNVKLDILPNKVPGKLNYYDKVYMLLCICDTIETAKRDTSSDTTKRNISIEKIESTIDIFLKSVKFKGTDEESRNLIRAWNVRWINYVSESWNGINNEYTIKIEI